MRDVLLKTMNSQNFYSILCKHFVFFGIRFELDFNWLMRLLSVMSSCIFNLFKANRLLALYLSIEKTNYPIRIVQLLELALDIWLYFFLLFTQDSISVHMNSLINSLSKHSKSQFSNKLKLYRIVYLIFVVEVIRLAASWWLTGTNDNLVLITSYY